MPETPLVIFLPSGRRGHFPPGTPLLHAARSLGVDVDSICGGRGLCGRCQVTVVSGEFSKFGIQSRIEHLSPFNELEQRYSKRKQLAIGRRLSCAACIEGPVVIDVPAESQLHKQIVRKRAEIRQVAIDPLLHLYYLELKPPSIQDQTSDLRRLASALKEQWNVTVTRIDPVLLTRLSSTLRQEQWRITVALREGAEIIAIWPGFRDQAYGLAVDLGTTTIATHLCDLVTGDVIAAAGVMNPQIRFGEDLISRLSYIQQNPDNASELTTVVRQAIVCLAEEIALEAGIARDDILDATLVGNPIMHHLLLGIDPSQIGRAPFPLVLDQALNLPARDLDLGLHPGAQLYLLPCIAGHVGADTAGVLLSEAPHQSDEIMLLVDVGTNAEIVLGNRDRLLACSSPTGPAFEGAQISCGQRAALGAVERVRIDPATLAPRFKVIGSDLWSDQPGFADSISDFGVTGICGSGIIEVIAEMSLSGLLKRSGLIDGERFPANPHLIRQDAVFAYCLYPGPPELLITQTDVRSIQLAKAALYAGAQLLMERLGVSSVDRIVLAGAFGSYIDPKHALALGMIPDCPLTNISAAGNAASTGARIALLNRIARSEIEALVQQVEKVETSGQEIFQKHFVAAMAVPHSKHGFPHLQSLLQAESTTV